MRRPVPALLALALVACLGPKPVVEDVSTSDVQDHKTTVSVAVRNTGAGDGPISVTVTVRDVSGEVVGREERSLEVRPHERVVIAIEVELPEDVHEISAEAEVRYPPH